VKRQTHRSGASADRRIYSEMFRIGVASGILPDIEGGILPPGTSGRHINDWQNDQPPD
jgi:hypothetical protein